MQFKEFNGEKQYHSPFTNRGPFLESPGNFFQCLLLYLFVSGVKIKTKDVLIHKNGQVYIPETSCMKGTRVHIKNT